MNFDSEFCRELNVKVYYKPDKTVNSIKPDYDIHNENNLCKISELYKDELYKKKLVKLFLLRIRSKNIKKAVEDCLNLYHKNPDNIIYSKLREVIHNLELNPFEPNVYDINNLLDRTFKKCLDISSNTEMVSVLESYKCKNRIKLDMPTLGFSDQYKSQSFSLVSLTMVLHHISVDYLDTFLTEINRIMEIGGILVMQEYTLNPLIRLNTHLLDIIHEYNHMVNYLTTPKTFEKEVNNYNTDIYWTKKMNEHGFEIYKDYPIGSAIEEFKNNPFGCKTILYIKI